MKDSRLCKNPPLAKMLFLSAGILIFFIRPLWAIDPQPVAYLPSAAKPSFSEVTSDLSVDNGELYPRPVESLATGGGKSINVEVISSSGALKAELPIAVPPGRNRLTPNLGLVYNSHHRNGWIGMGWNLNLRAIERSTRHGLDYGSDSYEMVVGGVRSELVRRSDWGADYFGRKSEHAFSKFSFRGTSGWVVFAKNGRRYYYGSNDGSRSNAAKGVFSWHLDRVEDANGNYMTYSYQKVQGRIYLSEVSYTGHVQTGLAPSNRIKFISVDRPDVILDGSASEVVATRRRLAVIEVYAKNKLCRKYKLEYEQGANSGRSRLKKILPIGTDGVDALPPILLNWQVGGPSRFQSPIISSRTVNYLDLLGDQEKVSLADVNGDARTDIVITRGARFFHRISNGDGTFDSIDTKKFHHMGVLIGHTDANGDGYSDVISYQRSYDGAPLYFFVHFGKGDGSYGAPIISRMPGTLREPPLNPNPSPGGWDQTPQNPVQGHLLRCSTYLGDVNGDGLSDVTLQWGGFWAHKFSNGDGTFRACDKINYTVGNALRYLDVNSDGLADILSWRRMGKYTHFYIYFGKGDGTYDEAIQSAVSTQSIPEAAVPLFGDLNGDDRPDMLLTYGLKCWPVLAGADGKFKAGSAFSFPYMAASQIYLTDVSGDGVDDLLGFFDQFQAYRQYISVSTGQVSPSQDLLSSVTDTSGASYSIGYRPSSQYNNGLLPFAVNTVSTVKIDDGLGSVSETSFDYASGLFDPATRSFAGFGRVQKKNPDQSTVVSWFHLDEHRRGLAYKVEQRETASGGGRLVRTDIEWIAEELPSGAVPGTFVFRKEKLVQAVDTVTVYRQDRFEYDSATGNLLIQESSGTDAETITRRYQYRNVSHWFWRKTSESLVGEGGNYLRKRIFDYEDFSGNLLRITNWLDNGQDVSVSFDYDLFGNQVSLVDARRHASSIEFDAATRTFPVKRTNPLGHTTGYTWDHRFGKTTRVIDENNNQTVYTYDAFGRLATRENPDGGFQSYQYDDQAMPRVVTSRTLEGVHGGTIDKYDYFDGLGRKVQSVTFGEEGKKIVRSRFYDAMGRNDLIEGPFFSSASLRWPIAPPAKYPWKQLSYDFRGRPVSVESSNGDHGSVVATTAYEGFAATMTDPDGAEKIERRDFLGRIIEVVERSERGDYRTRYSYNAAGDLVKVVDHYGNTTLIFFDTLGRKVQMSDPDMGIWFYEYDANDNIVLQTDAKQQTIAFAYDALNRLVSKNYSTGEPPVSYEYDKVGVSNGIGRLYSISNSVAATSTNAYDEMGRVLSTSKTFAGNAQSFTTEFDYDLSGKQVSMRYPDGYQVSNEFYPGTNLLQSVSGEDGTEFADLTDYAPSGKIGRMDHGNGTYTIHSYDPDTARISAIVTGRLGPVATYQEKHYSYSKAGDITTITDGVDDAVFNYAYDKLHRMTSETSNKYDPITYTYDAIGNITSKTVGSTSMVYSYDSDHPHAVRQISLNGTPYEYTYDANGNMTGGPDFSDPANVAIRNFTYNADNMPLSVSREMGDSAVANEFQYDGSNVRSRKFSSGGKESFYISETTELIDGVLHHYVFAGDLRVAKIAGGELTFYHKDHLGSSSVVSNIYGEAIKTTCYRPFGSVRNSAGNQLLKYGYTDQERDAEIGLYNYDARLYDAVTGRFITADTIVPRMFTPQNLNRYSYCRQNPLIYSDPSGYFSLSVTGVSMGVEITGEVYSSNNNVNPAPQIAVSPTIVGGYLSISKDDLPGDENLTTIGLKGLFSVVADETGHPIAMTIGLTLGARVSPSMAIDQFAISLGSTLQAAAISIADMIQGTVSFFGGLFSSTNTNEEPNSSEENNGAPPKGSAKGNSSVTNENDSEEGCPL